jgi:hypothetical protein
MAEDMEWATAGATMEAMAGDMEAMAMVMATEAATTEAMEMVMATVMAMDMVMATEMAMDMVMATEMAMATQIMVMEVASIHTEATTTTHHGDTIGRTITRTSDRGSLLGFKGRY